MYEAMDLLPAASNAICEPRKAVDCISTGVRWRMLPMYRWASQRIETHIKICVLALQIERVAEIRSHTTKIASRSKSCVSNGYSRFVTLLAANASCSH